MDVKDWLYEDHIDEPRRNELARVGSYDALVPMVVDDLTDAVVRSAPGRDKGLTHCIQPIFSFDLPTTGDALFNGPYGYRAQYWIDPHRGLAANSSLIAAITPKLLAALSRVHDADLERINVCASLSAASAKIWIRESSILAAPTRDLRVRPWIDRAEEGVELARLGLMAPTQTKFEVKGALIDPYGHEVVPIGKTTRHYQIHRYGFS